MSSVPRARVFGWMLSSAVVPAYAVLFVAWALLSLLLPGFGGFGSVMSNLHIAAFVGFVAVGQSMAMLLGEIDLSIGATLTLGALVSTQLGEQSGGSTLVVLLALLAIGTGVGLLNAAGITYLGVAPLIMTLGTSSVVTGLGLLYSGGTPKGTVPRAFEVLGAGSWAGVPLVVFAWAAVAVGTLLLLHRSTVGRRIYAFGVNRVCAVYSGVSPFQVRALVYGLSGVMAAVTGGVLAGYSGLAYLGVGEPYTLAAVAASVLGGVDPLGGRGTYAGAIAGAIVLTMVQSALTMINVSEAIRQMSSGLLIIALLLTYSRRKTPS